jgi:hypothetical protein
MPRDSIGVTDSRPAAHSSEVQLFVEGIPALVFTYTPDGRIESVNHQVLEYFGRPFAELQTWQGMGALHPDDIDRVTLEWRHHISRGLAYVMEQRLRRADGIYRWSQLRVAPRTDLSGHLVRWYGIVTDIEDLKCAEEQTRASEQELRLLIDSIPAMVFTTTSAGELEWVNRPLLNYFGRTAEELRDWRISDAVHPDDLAHTIAHWRQGVASGQPYQFEQRLRRADGVYRWFTFRAEPLRDPADNVNRWYGTVSDIDDLKRAEEGLRNVQARFSRAAHLATVSELAASIAHEIKQPLAAAVATAHACVQWLSAETPNVQRAQSSAERIVRDLNSAAEVVSRIRSLFKQAPPTKQLLNINDVIAEVSGLMADDLRAKQVSLQCLLQVDLPLVAADRIHLQQLLANLIRNGIEAMGQIDDRPRQISIASRRREAEISVAVSDCGVGIAAPEAVFEPFYTTKPHGMGMGLAICRTIVEAHEGRIWTERNSPYGTTVSFALRTTAT